MVSQQDRSSPRGGQLPILKRLLPGTDHPVGADWSLQVNATLAIFTTYWDQNSDKDGQGHTLTKTT